jgi:hypothetical protein
MDELEPYPKGTASTMAGGVYLSSLTLPRRARLEKDSNMFRNRKRKNKAKRSSPVAEPATLAFMRDSRFL